MDGAMPNARARRGDAKPTREPDAPRRIALIGTSRCSATIYPVVAPRVHEGDDRRLQQELERLLQERLDDASNVAISVEGGCVLLHGIVSCTLARPLAEDLVFSVPEVSECHNEPVTRAASDASLAA